MKSLFFLVLTTLTIHVYGQSKLSYNVSNLTEVAGTSYVIVSVRNWGKSQEANYKYFLFINTTTGDTNRVDFPNEAEFGRLEQIKLDSLAINLILVEGKTVDMNEKNGIDWSDPTQIFVLSTDGQSKTQLTENSFFVSSWVVNRLTGRIVIHGNIDSNENNKYDKTDKKEIRIYDLKTLQLIRTL